MSESVRSLVSNKTRDSNKSETILSENIDMSQLENIANLKKLNKKEDLSHVSMNVSVINNDKPPVSNDDNISSKMSNSSIYNKKNMMSTDSLESDSAKKRKRARRANRENKDEQIRKEKADLLYKLHLFSQKKDSSAYGILKMDLNYTLEEIKFEYSRIKALLDNERMVNFSKRILLMGIQGVEMLNNTFDPLGVDLNGWSEAMGYSMENQEYDEVLSELCEKYKGSGNMSPEVKLILIIIGSGFMFTASKKIAKMDTSSMFSNILGNFMNKQAPSPQQQVPQQPQFPPQFQPQFQQQSIQPQYQASNFQSIQQTSHAPQPFLGGNVTMIHQQDDSEMSNDSDKLPSRIRPPPNLDTNELENIIKTMNDAKQKKQHEQNKKSNETSESAIILKQIPPLKKKGGRPKKIKL